MQIRDIQTHKYHYTALIVIEAILLTVFVGSKDQVLQILSAIAVGIFYFFWGIISHAGELRPIRLMLEYAVVGLLGTLILIILVRSV